MMNHIMGMLFSPHREWEIIRQAGGSAKSCYFKCVFIMGIIPVIAWYFGLTEVGWQLGGRVIRFSQGSALQIMVLFYFAILFGVAFLGYMVHWMSKTYDAPRSSIGKGIGIVAYTFTPLFVIGVAGFYPILWLDILLFSAAAAWAVYLLYIGVPIVLEIPEEKGFLYASAMASVGLVMCAALLGATVILWDMGAMPVFID